MQETKTKKALLSIKNFFIKLWNYYTLYEKIWFLSITILAFVFAFVFPEEDIGGVNGKGCDTIINSIASSVLYTVFIR